MARPEGVEARTDAEEGSRMQPNEIIGQEDEDLDQGFDRAARCWHGGWCRIGCFESSGWRGLVEWEVECADCSALNGGSAPFMLARR